MGCLEARNLAFMGRVVAEGALMRTESRGQHFRADYPQKDDDNWLKWLVRLKCEAGGDLGHASGAPSTRNAEEKKLKNVQHRTSN